MPANDLVKQSDAEQSLRCTLCQRQPRFLSFRDWTDPDRKHEAIEKFRADHERCFELHRISLKLKMFSRPGIMATRGTV